MEKFNLRRKVHLALGSLQTLIGLGALGGGFMLIKDPSGSALGVPLDFLEGSPFPDFLIPGIFLLTVNGIGTLIGAFYSFKRKKYAPEIAIVLGAILAAWIVIQVLIISSFSWMHVFYFILGFLELGLGVYLRRIRFKTT